MTISQVWMTSKGISTYSTVMMQVCMGKLYGKMHSGCDLIIQVWITGKVVSAEITSHCMNMLE